MVAVIKSVNARSFDMIKTIIFDLDGVLIESKEIHYKDLNAALPFEYRIGYEEHLSTYDGLPTKQKLELLGNFININLDDDLLPNYFDKYRDFLLNNPLKIFTKDILELKF